MGLFGQQWGGNEAPQCHMKPGGGCEDMLEIQPSNCMRNCAHAHACIQMLIHTQTWTFATQSFMLHKDANNNKHIQAIMWTNTHWTNSLYTGMKHGKFTAFDQRRAESNYKLQTIWRWKPNQQLMNQITQITSENKYIAAPKNTSYRTGAFILWWSMGRPLKHTSRYFTLIHLSAQMSTSSGFKEWYHLTLWHLLGATLSSLI